MTGRKLCAIESAALSNPNRQILVLMNAKKSHIRIPWKWLIKAKSSLISDLASIFHLSIGPVSNVQFMKLDMDEYVERSPLRKVWLEKLKPKINQFKATMSNLMRALYFSTNMVGLFLDMDTTSIKPFPKDIANFVVDGNWTFVRFSLIKLSSRS